MFPCRKSCPCGIQYHVSGNARRIRRTFMKNKSLPPALQIFIGLGLGILAGILFLLLGMAQWTETYLRPFGTIFLNLIKFIVVPIVLSSIIAGVVSMRDIKKVGSIGTAGFILEVIRWLLLRLLVVLLHPYFGNCHCGGFRKQRRAAALQ